MKECPACHKEFKPASTGQKYCCRKCTKAASQDRTRKRPKRDTRDRDYFPDDITACPKAFEYFQG